MGGAAIVTGYAHIRNCVVQNNKATDAGGGHAPTSATIFHPMNLLMVGVILVLMPFVNYAMHPDKDHTIVVDPALLVDEKEREYKIETPADKIEHSRILWVITLVLGFAYIVYYFVQKGFNLDLNIVNMIFLFLGILLHGDLRKYVEIGRAHV